MSQDHLGLFDTPPGPQQIRLSLAIVGLLFAALLFVLPLANIRLGAVNAFVPMVDAIMLSGKLIIGTQLYAQAASHRSRALTVVGSGYVLDGLLLVPHALTFPGAFTATGLLGAGVNTTGWLIFFERFAFPTVIMLYVCFKRMDFIGHAEAKRSPPLVLWGLAGAITLTVFATLLATVGHDLLPPLFLNQREPIQPNLAIATFVTIALTVTAMILVICQEKSVLDVWLLVALSGWLIESLLTLSLHARFTLGWYCLFGVALVSSTTVMLALITESNRLSARLALSLAAREREREARLVAIDAVAAAVAYEAGQALAAIRLNANAGLLWLNHNPPNTEMAIKALHDAVDAGSHAFDMMTNIRATVAPGPGGIGDFDLNDLVREATTSLAKEMAAEGILLQLALDDSLPPIRANRVQIRRVLVHLLTNAIDSLAATPRRARRISISSARGDDRTVLLQISDSGRGIPPDKMAKIFEPFYTTKSKNAGLGLSLSRTIVEDHGGVLWASADCDHGATFHLHLASAPAEGL